MCKVGYPSTSWHDWRIHQKDEQRAYHCKLPKTRYLIHFVSNKHLNAVLICWIKIYFLCPHFREISKCLSPSYIINCITQRNKMKKLATNPKLKFQQYIYWGRVHSPNSKDHSTYCIWYRYDSHFLVNPINLEPKFQFDHWTATDQLEERTIHLTSHMIYVEKYASSI